MMNWLDERNKTKPRDSSLGKICFACHAGFHEDCWLDEAELETGIGDCLCDDEWCVKNKQSAESLDKD